MKKLLVAWLALAAACAAQTCTQITDTLYGADGNAIANGTLHITTTLTVNSGGATVIPKPIETTITNGHLSVCLIPNTYEVVYRTPGMLVRQWIVPSGGPYTVLQIEQLPTNVVPSGTIALSMLSSGNATLGQPLCWLGSTWGPGSCGSGGGGGAVSSVFGRTGAVTAQTGDYTAAQVTNALSSTGSYANPAWLTSLAWSKLTSVPTLVNSFNGRNGTLTPASGDYTCAQVTNCVDQTGNYSNPGWISSLAWSKVTGAPSFYYQTVQANATAQTQRANLNFSTNFSLTDSSPNNRTTVDLAGTITSNTSGNAGTATALASTPSQCSSGQYSTGIAAGGAANCAQVAYSQISGTPTLYYQTFQHDGTAVTQRPKFNMAAGSNVTITATDNGTDTTTFTVAASGGTRLTTTVRFRMVRLIASNMQSAREPTARDLPLVRVKTGQTTWSCMRLRAAPVPRKPAP